MKSKLYMLFGGLVTIVILGLMGASISSQITPQIYQDVFTFTKSATTSDTSGWYSLGGGNVIELTDYYGGATSATITTYVLGQFSGGASKLVYTGTARTTAAVTHVNLRQLDSSLIGACEQIKIAHTVICGDDSSALLKCYTNLLTR
jgi:hypothetical protein